jgi:hypothetical protein
MWTAGPKRNAQNQRVELPLKNNSSVNAGPSWVSIQFDTQTLADVVNRPCRRSAGQDVAFLYDAAVERPDAGRWPQPDQEIPCSSPPSFCRFCWRPPWP